ncbi:MAG: hypothetical protein PUP92_09235 [Rhizonema sp. PD38]|nr:hypothetical protein [Rhizonema sp. PD38]
MPTTVAPVRRTSCVTSDPTPPAAPETRTVSLRWGATAAMAAFAVAATMNRAPLL